jgi:methylthioxylose transferase
VKAHVDRSGLTMLALGLAAVAGLARWLMAGRPLGLPGEWVWEAIRVPVNLLPGVCAIVLFLVVAWWLARLNWRELPRGRRTLWLLVLVLAIFVLQAALINGVGVPWVSPGSIIVSPNATTYFSTALGVQDVRKWVANYPSLMPSLPYHARTHPPGMVLFFHAIRRAMAGVVPDDSPQLAEIAEAYRIFGIGPTAADAAAAIFSAFLIALIGALSVIPVYLLSKELMQDEQALRVAVLAGTLPALLILSVSPDLLLLTLVATTLWLSYLAWKYARPLPALLAGVVIAFSSFLSLGVMAVAGWLLLLALVGTLRRPDRPATVRLFLKVGAAGVLGFVLVYGVLVLALDYHPLAVARQALGAHRGVTTVEAARTYWKWVLLNPVEFALFAGLPLTIAACWAIPLLRRDPETRCLQTFLLASLLALAFLDVSGTVRGEVGRIWLFLMWPLAMAAGPVLGRERNVAFVGLVALQLLQALLFRAYLTLYSVL